MPQSILSPFQILRETSPRHRVFTVLDEHGRDEASLTVGELGAAADRIAATLRAWGFVPGDRAILVYPPSTAFVGAVLGCLAAGVVPVPVPPPNPFRLAPELERLNAVADRTGVRGILSTRAYERSRTAGVVANFFHGRAPGWPNLPWYRTDAVPDTDRPVAWHQPSADEPALVGVMHGALAREVVHAVDQLALGPDARSVFWVPEHDDAGLIGLVLATIASDSQTALLPSATFMRRPAAWFDALTRTRATHTAAPEFAFAHAVRATTAEQRSAWDLRSLQVVMAPAEPADQATLPTFFAAFAGTGLDARLVIRNTALVNVGEGL